MVKIKQFGDDGRVYDTNDYPYVLLVNDVVSGRLSTLEKAHEARLMTALNNPEDKIMLFNEKTNSFLQWRKKERLLLAKYKDEPSDYFDKKMRM